MRTQFDKLALHRRGLPLGEREDHSVKPAIRVSILQRQDVNFLACQEAQDASAFVRHGHLGHHARLAPHQLFAVLARENILNRRNVYLRRGEAHIKSQSFAINGQPALGTALDVFKAQHMGCVWYWLNFGTA